MDPGDALALGLAGAANLAGLAAVGVLWARRRRRRRVVQSRHPSVRPPLVVSTIGSGDDRRLRIEVPIGAPVLAIDIVSFRPADPLRAWESEPLVDPIIVRPGTGRTLDTPVGADAELDVVVAWTARHATGEVPGSRLFRLPADRDRPAPPPPRTASLAAWPAVALAAALAIGGALVVTADGSSADDVTSAPTTAPAITIAGATTSLPAMSTTTSSTTSPTTSSTTTTTTTTTTPTTTTATTTPTTTTSSTPGTTLPDGPTVTATARLGPCRFGDDCLIVGFTITGFEAPQPEEYVCEFEDGSRFTFRFQGDGADTACSTGSATAAIIVEVAGVRSAALTRDDVTPDAG